MTTTTFLPRRLGEFTLVAQLSEDTLGTVYRAIHDSEDGRFLRLRVLQAPELSPEFVLDAIEQNAQRVTPLSHKTIVQRHQLGVADGVPYLAWHEPSGWTLDFVLAKLRAAKQRIPVPYALLIAQRVAAALEHAWFSLVDGEPTRHGLLWPGFVSISPDAEIRVGGFGLVDAVLPTLHKPRLAREIAPYLPAETRATGVSGDSSDVYSVGAILEEMVTGRRPPETPDRSEGDREDDPAVILRPILERTFAPPGERFSSPVEANRALQELLAGGSSPISSTDLALFLYDLLNPESRSVIAAVDGDSTNPVPRESPPEPAPAPAVIDRPVISEPAPPRPQRFRVFASAAVIAAALILVGGATAILRARARPIDRAAEVLPAASPFPAVAMLPPSPPVLESRPQAPRRARAGGQRDSARRARAHRPAPPPEERSSVESARLGAGLARIAAERREAPELATNAFSAAQEQERAGEASLRGGKTASARDEFGRAAGLFHEAEELARQERVKRVKLGDAPPE